VFPFTGKVSRKIKIWVFKGRNRSILKSKKVGKVKGGGKTFCKIRTQQKGSPDDKEERRFN